MGTSPPKRSSNATRSVTFTSLDRQTIAQQSVRGDIAELRAGEGKLHMFVAIDRTSKFTFVCLEKRATSMTARAFLEALIEAVPYRIHTILTDNGLQFAPLPKNRNGMTARYMGHPFGNLCRDHEIEHRLTKPKHPWTNGQVERMNRTIKDATVKRVHHDDHDQLRRHLSDFVDAYNFARRLKTLRGLTPYGFICKIRASEPERFNMDPHHQMPGLNMSAVRRISGSGMPMTFASLPGYSKSPRKCWIAAIRARFLSSVLTTVQGA